MMILLINITFFSTIVFAGPTSTNFKLESYTFGGGGSEATSTNYKIQGTIGEISGKSNSTTFKMGAGLTFLLNAHTPPAPTLSNPGSNYDRLKIIINQGGNAPDVTYALAISTDNFVSDIKYIKSDATVGTTLSASDFQTYSSWGGASGFYVTGLSQNTTYYVRAKARHGTVSYTESEWGPATSGVTTSVPTLTFSVSSSTVTFDNLNAGNSYTDSSKTTVLTVSTNAYNGYVVNARSTGPLTNGSNTIADYSSPNSAPTVWSGTGFGYTTNDNDLSGGTNNRFASGTKYAGFTTASPGDPVADHQGPVTSPINNEQFTISYRVTADSSTKAGTYTTTVLYNVVPEY
ncbi:MAG: hypothetical protein KatS3mg089_0886 [Patescibacteria group bacterium]|nr:MAG: hypothetical protein KatS3mg089_0886 [Patescibacteria group bacterium]